MHVCATLCAHVYMHRTQPPGEVLGAGMCGQVQGLCSHAPEVLDSHPSSAEDRLLTWQGSVSFKLLRLSKGPMT